MGGLTLADISDLRAYERERETFRAQVIALKKLRRVSIGPLVTVVFENRTTVRFQIQEMARAEKMATDEEIAGELAIYNPLIPGPGELSMTLFVELTSEEQLRTWLAALVGIERSVVLRVGDGEGSSVIRASVEAAHESQLTRENVTASVHYVRLSLPAGAAAAFGAGPAVIGIDHPAYQHEETLSDETRASLVEDWEQA